ncbi:Histidine kinase-, DNA gyrase B-, and HSP90-like ATPase [Legionella busanensis]|uniref:Histidine kinase-, DNA gyrase B-, and HSP90-like ATPase n=1 Tax=Legionella busanensis TaxID=190655 RepID=A0A378JKP5_9GAMM|nr:ATP-binding protein [Legionella busanensis]STX51754.1 Histidine kinase-, DNA gyrase B-, and HSP90-like ATPase [Legionella busanensis]
MKLIISYKLDSIENVIPEKQIEIIKLFSYSKSDFIVRKIIEACNLKHPNLEKIPAYNILKNNLNEIINNCLDSIAEKRLVNNQFDMAIIEVVIIDNGHTLIMKLKDNGIGLGENYLHKLSYPEFKHTKSQEHFKKKEKDYCIGGCGIGLFHLNAKLAKNDAKLYLKSRKEAGATIEISMKKPY